MSKGLNSIQLVGRAGQDAEIKTFDSGTQLATITIAVNRYAGKGDDGKAIEETDWFTVKAWGKTGEILGEYVKKGHLFGVTGHVEQESWTDDAGQKKSRHVVVARDVVLLQSKPREDEPPANVDANKAKAKAVRPF